MLVSYRKHIIAPSEAVSGLAEIELNRNLCVTRCKCMRVSAAYEQCSVAVTLSLHETALVGFVLYSPSSRHILACFPRTVPVMLETET